MTVAATDSSLDQRIADAALRCVARWGLAKTTLEDVAREAGCSRATVYRCFPGGKPALLQEVSRREAARLMLHVTSLVRDAEDLEELLVTGIGGAARFLRDHEALGTLIRHEPQTLLPFLAFDRLGPLVAGARWLLTPAVSRFVDVPLAGDVVEWAARLVLSYTFSPNASMDLSEPDHVARLVRVYMLPGIGTATPTLSTTTL